MSAQNSAGIQTLLDAEREAQKIVQKAADCSDDWADSSESLCVPLYGPPADRTKTPPDRTQKVKDARSEAQKEIEAYKKQKESEFKKFEAEHSGANAKIEEEAIKEIEQKLKDIEISREEKGAEVVDDLLSAVIGVKPEPHRNVAASA